MNQDPRRLFNEKERAALYLAADGKSDLSGRPLNDEWHADHIVPWSKDGETDVSNGQALTAAENIKKSDTYAGLRGWQKEFLAKYQTSARDDFMLAALPGAGKTVASLHGARIFLNDPVRRRLVVVVPTSNLREQWRDEASLFGITLQTKEFRGTLKTDFDGVVTTYASVASNPMLFRRLCALHDCMVIFDEIHHAGDRSSWGVSIQEAFENARRRLCLSGTPFKSDGQRIPFLRVGADSSYEIDFAYDYPRALKEGVVREVSFHRHGGEVTLAVREEILEFSTNDDLDEDDTSKRLRGLLRSPKWTRDLLAQAHDRLLAVRRAKPDAGGLVLCIDANHAVSVAKFLEEITGEQPDVIVSDDDLATGSVKAFRKSNRKWVVAVRMVSEGVDIKRLMVLVYLTTTTTDLFFRQAVGRIVRSEGTDFDTEAYCFIPEDPRLAEHARRIREFQAQVIEEDEKIERSNEERAHAAERALVTVLGSSHADFVGLTTGGEHHETDLSLEIVSLADEFQIPEGKMAALFERLAGRKANVPPPVMPSAPDEHLEDKLARLRRQCSRLTNKLSAVSCREQRFIHADYKRLTNVGQDQMTVSQLEAKRQWLLKQLNEATQR